MNEATELEFLKWFYLNTDFGPADSEVKELMMRDFEQNQGKTVPAEYREGYL